MKFISLFAGVGGFDLALTRLGHECVYANDFDKYCKITYDKHFTHKLDCRSITEVTTNEIPDHELLVGGFPCQSFSIAGKRKGFQDTRGTMFFEIARILQAKQPRLFILENVKGLLSHDNGATFKTIIATLTELGYDLQWQVLNSKNFGVPQNRERVFIVGHLRGTSRPEVFPIGEADGKDTGTNTKRSSISAQTVTAQGGLNARGTFIGTLRTHKDGNGFREMKSGIAPTIPARAREDGSGQPCVAVVRNRGQFEERTIVNTLDANYYKGLDAHQQRTGIFDGVSVRRLTPNECEKLQGFPVQWTAGISDTQRYKQMGNAVTVNVVYEIAKLITPARVL